MVQGMEWIWIEAGIHRGYDTLPMKMTYSTRLSRATVACSLVVNEVHPCLKLCYNPLQMLDNYASTHPTFMRASIFTGLSCEQIQQVAGCFKQRRLEDDTYLFHQDEPADAFYLILDGQVKIQQTTAEGFEVILHILGPGELVGALPTLGDGTYPASALTLGQTLAASIDAESFYQLLDVNPIIGKNLLRYATQLLQSSLGKIRELATQRVERRIARTLTRLASRLGREHEGQIYLDFPLSRQDLAELTGTSIFTVSRTLNTWEREGVLALGRERIVILSPHKLVAIGEDLPNGSH